MTAARTIIRNALLLDLDPIQVRRGELRVEMGIIVAVGPRVEAVAGDVVIDAGGAVVMPGLVNGHTHLYSALAVGMPPPADAPRNFHEILQRVWWRLDQALDLPLVEASASVGALEALHCGTTTLIDHHASPNAIGGSLDAIESGLRRVGPRGVLCYETTDRHGREGREAGLRENDRYLRKCGDESSGADGSAGRDGCCFAGLAGAHAAFTMGDDALSATADLARSHSVGVHIHVAEDPCDARICAEQFGAALFDRLDRAGILERPSILAHCTHLSEADAERLNTSKSVVAHNPRSNMNNAVGYARVPRIRRPVLLGTDGISGDVLAEMQAAWFKWRDSGAMARFVPEDGPVEGGAVEATGGSRGAAHGLEAHATAEGGATLGPGDFVQMVVNAARRASQSLGITLGRLEPGAAADLMITSYVPATALTAENAAAHLVFALGSRHVRHVMIAGQWKLRDRAVTMLDEAAYRRTMVSESRRLWERMAELP